MSPPDEPGRGNRTVILPNPGGRRSGAPDAQPPQQWGGAEDWGCAQPSPAPPYPAPPAYPATPPSYPAGPPSYPTPGPAAGGYGAPTYPSADRPQQAPDSAGALLNAEPALNSNEMLRASAPLLLMLGKLRANLVRVPSEQIMADVARSIATFGNAVTTSGYSADQAEVARYALCATADDVVQNIAVDDRSMWTRYSMLSKFFQERTGGVRFFEELGRMRQNPLGNIDVLELMYACLAVGFEGVTRTAPNGVATLQQTQRELYDVIRRVRPREGFELSPRWQGSGLALADRGRRVPLWAIASFGLALVVGTLVVLKLLLADRSAALADEMVALYPTTEIALIRPDYVPRAPPPPPPEPEPTPEPLPAPEPAVAAPPPEPAPPPPATVDIGQQLASLPCVDLEEANGAIRISFGDCQGEALFASGRASINDAYLSQINQIAAAIETIPGTVHVVGHTDNVPTRGVRFASNYDLSVARAQTVAQIVADGLSVPSRIVAEGRGDTVPIADNGTPEGRARNRRVDVIVRTDA